jgi:hypothetical protein
VASAVELCRKCGEEFPDTANYCPNCGAARERRDDPLQRAADRRRRERARLVNLHSEFMGTPTLRIFLVNNSDVLTNEAYKIFVELTREVDNENPERARYDSRRAKNAVERLRILRQFVDGDIEKAFLSASAVEGGSQVRGGTASSSKYTRATTEDLSYVEVHAEERGLAGRSFARNIFGQSSLANWELLGRIVSDHLRQPVDYYVVKFQLIYGQAIETSTGLDREEAQSALRSIHDMIVHDGWRQISSGTYWFSYRYVGDTSIVDKIAGP